MHVFVRCYNKGRKRCIPEKQLSVSGQTHRSEMGHIFGYLIYYCYYQLNSHLIVHPSNIEVTKVRRSVNQSS